MNQRKENKIPDLLSKARWILPVLLWVALILFSKDYLMKVEERSYFEFDLFWLSEYLCKPSGVLSLFGLFLTQFLHIPWVGALIWVLLLTASAELTRIVFRIPAHLSVLAYLPASIFVAYNLSMGYIVYVMNLPGYFFLPVLGCLWALLTIKVFRKSRKPAISLLLALFWGFAGYYIAGFYALAGIAAACIDIILSDHSRICRIMTLTGAVAVIILAPILFVGTTTYNISNGWTIGMPEQIYELSQSRMQIPLIPAFLLLIIAPFSKHLSRISGTRVLSLIQGVSLAAAIAIPSIFWFRDDNFKAELGMIRAADNLEWNKAVSILEQVQSRHEDDPDWEPTRVMVVLKDLALIKTGREGQRIFDFEDGDKEQKRSWNLPMSFQIGRILHLNYGIPGLCNRWLIEETVFFGSNYQTYKYHAMNAILLNDTQFALKYLDKLEHTLFYRKWAKEQRKLCTDRSLVAKTAPYDMILPLMCYEDQVCSDFQGCEFFLMEHFNGPRPENATPLYDRVALFFAMKNKQSTLFWTRFFLYLDSNNPKKIDRYYQEAAYLFSQNNKELMEAIPYDDQVKTLYNSFVQNAAKTGKMNHEEARQNFAVNLRHTYFYYYYYVNELVMF